MATKKKAQPEAFRRCIGSVKFGIEAHEAPVADFPSQPSQKDGLGRMCKVDWARYTAALRKAATPPKPAPASVAEVERPHVDTAKDKVARTGRAKAAPKPEPIRTKAPRKPKAGEAPAEA